MDKGTNYSEFLFNLIPSAIFCVDTQRNVTRWNKKAEEITGYTAEEVLGRPPRIWIEDTCKEKSAIVSSKTTKPVFSKECTIRTKSGEIRHVTKNSDLLLDMKGEVIGGIEVFEDITNRRNDEFQIKQMETDWGKTFNSITDLISIQDRSNKLIMVNEAYARVFNISVEECAGKLCHNIVHGTHECIPECPHQKSIKSKKPR